MRPDLREPVVDETFVRDAWRGIEARRRPTRTSLLPWVLAGASTCVALGLIWAWPSDPTPAVSIGGLQLADGSQVDAANASLKKLFDRPSETRLLLEQGRALFAVTKRDRRFVVECGFAQVEVIGTRFALDRSADRLEVEVFEGRVLVRSRHLAKEVQVLEANQRLVVRQAPAAPPPPPPVVVEPVAPPPPPPPVSRRPVVDPPAPTEAQLWTRIDAARRDGDLEDAVADLRQILDRPDGQTHGLAAVTLARIHLQANDLPTAIGYWQRALSSGLPAALEEDARAEMVIAYARSGQTSQAAAARDAYLERFPEGSRRDEVLQWAPPP